LNWKILFISNFRQKQVLVGGEKEKKRKRSDQRKCKLKNQGYKKKVGRREVVPVYFDLKGKVSTGGEGPEGCGSPKT